MRFWQHLCIGAFILYLAFVATVTWGGFLEQLSPAKSTLCMLLMIFLPFVLGPAAAMALVADIRARWLDAGKRGQWTWLCLLLWPVGLYYYVTFGFRKIPARQTPPPIPTFVPAAAVPAIPPPLPDSMQKSKAADNSVVWGAVSMVGPFFPLALPASFAGIIYGHKGLSEIKRSNGLFKNRGAAVGGLCLSYGSLILTGLMVIHWINLFASIREESARNAPENLKGEPGYAAAREAERRMDSFITNQGEGNNTEAARLASSFGQGIARIQELNFVPYSAASKTRVNTRPFVFCHLEEGACVAFVKISVPLALSSKDRDEFYSVLWAELHDVVAAVKALKPGSRLALAIREHRSYKAIYLGEFQGAPADEKDIPKFFKPGSVNDLETRRLLYSYFAAKSPEPTSQAPDVIPRTSPNEASEAKDPSN